MIVSLFYSKKGKIYPEERKLFFDSKDLNEKILKTFEELIQGPSGDLINPIPEGTRILNLFLDKEGILYLNFSQEIKANHPGGISSEHMTASSIVFTALNNFPEIKGVMILIDDEEHTSLAGHLDISRPLKIAEVFETPLGSL